MTIQIAMGLFAEATSKRPKHTKGMCTKCTDTWNQKRWLIKYILAFAAFYTDTRLFCFDADTYCHFPAHSAYHAPVLTNCVTVSSICLSDRPGGE